MTPTKSSHDIDLLAKAGKYTMGKALVDRLKKLINLSEEKDKVELAINYAHSVTKSEMRGSK